MSNALYDKHYYVIHLTDGRTVEFADYEHMRSWWMVHYNQGVLDYVTVHDAKHSLGFGN